MSAQIPTPDQVLKQLTAPLGGLGRAGVSAPAGLASPQEALKPLVTLEKTMWQTFVETPLKTFGVTAPQRLPGPAEATFNILSGQSPLAEGKGFRKTAAEGETTPTPPGPGQKTANRTRYRSIP